ncbi:alpha/beta fold hydrolase [Natronomonas amylolytica]|uniref:alpha/beta fold hydrolase n=1 Tax=Natronomonas amylolytica TaxID=3108498 RepID=UPI00300A39C3
MASVRTGDIDTYYERNGEGPAIVFVHGAILDSAAWLEQADALSDEYTTVTYDVRGHGRTGGSDRNVYSVELLADDLHALVEALDLDRPVICGLSLGGCIAQVYATKYPESLSGLVLADTFTPPYFSRRERFQRSTSMRGIIPIVRLVGYERVEELMVWVNERVHGEGVSGEYGRVEALREEGPPMATAEFAKVIRALASFHETNVEHAAIAVPTLVLYGENEPPFIKQHAIALAETVPDVTVQAVPDAGHASNLDNPPFFTNSVRAFLKNQVLAA